MTDAFDAIPSPTDLRELADRSGPVLSLFVPVTASIPGRAQNAVRAARLAESGLEKLRGAGLDSESHGRAEQELGALVSGFDTPGPSTRSRAAFWSADAGLRVFGLPWSETERVGVAEVSAMRPIVRAARRACRYRVLVLSDKRIELYEGESGRLERVTDSKIPGSLDEALGTERTEPRLQFHSTGGSGNRPLYHGQGGAPDERKIDLDRLHQRVARALEEEIGDDRRPLVLVCEGRHRPALQDALRRDVGLLAEGVEGNPDALSPSELERLTWPIILDQQPSARDELDRAREEGGFLISQIPDLVQYATMGRIGRLWVPERGGIPGRLDPTTASVAPPKLEDDLIEALVVHVIRRGGEVLVLEDEDRDEKAANLIARPR
jgi:hypothetical protein